MASQSGAHVIIHVVKGTQGHAPVKRHKIQQIFFTSSQPFWSLLLLSYNHLYSASNKGKCFKASFTLKENKLRVKQQSYRNINCLRINQTYKNTTNM